MKFKITFFITFILANFAIRPCVALSVECDHCFAECMAAANAWSKVSGEDYQETYARCSTSRCKKPGAPCAKTN
jgi:hypothetical protein